MKKDKYINKYCRGRGLEIGGADNTIEDIDTIKVDNKLNFCGKEYSVDCLMDATSLQAFSDNQFDFVITNHVLEHLPNPIKAYLEWARIVRHDGYIVTAIPKKSETFDRYRDKTPLYHLLEDFRYDVGPSDATHTIEWIQFAAPVVLHEWKSELVPNALIIHEITSFYRGGRRFIRNQKVCELWKHLESEKIRLLDEVRKGYPTDIHHHVWESVSDVKDMIKCLLLDPVEIVDNYQACGILFVVKVNKHDPRVQERIKELKEGKYPDWVERVDLQAPDWSPGSPMFVWLLKISFKKFVWLLRRSFKKFVWLLRRSFKTLQSEGIRAFASNEI
jgi:SAM-dependent methyltransferase